MFMVVFKNDYNGRFTILKTNIPSLEVALEARVVSGDLVVSMDTFCVVNDLSWLFDWERNEGNSYAQRQMGKILDESKAENPEKLLTIGVMG